jgi:Family of unknown function (DUF6603)
VSRAVADEGVARIDLPGLRVRVVGNDLPPTRIFVSLDVPGAKGEGELVRDGTRYRGKLHVAVGPVVVEALAIIATGTEPELLVLLSAEFVPPIQLSSGFTLLDVGGIVGINRRPDDAQLRTRSESGELGRLLFPGDVFEQADALLPLLDSCFPHQPASFVVGPLLRVGWGTPTTVFATVGALVSDDAVTIIGRVVVALPTTDAPIVHLEALVVGRFDDRGLAIDASLVDSNIAGTSIHGDMRLRVVTTAPGSFAFSAGGFHPAFPVPAGMAGMRRLDASISPGPILTARLEAYVAITTNSAQFGARLDLRAQLAGFGIRGHASFDALFRFDPFRFETEFDASVTVTVAGEDVVGVSLHASLSGPTPWRIRGHATITLLLVPTDVDIPALQWGPEQTATLPPARDPVDVLVHELGIPANWVATEDGVPGLVQFGPRVDGVAVHPLAASLGFRQRAVPLGVLLRRMDGVRLAAPCTIAVAGDASGQPGADLARAGQVLFVRQQFDDLDDAARLSGAGFALWDGGVELSAGGTSFGTVAAASDDYQTWIVQGGVPTLLQPAAPTGTVIVGHRNVRTLHDALVSFRPRPVFVG